MAATNIDIDHEATLRSKQFADFKERIFNFLDMKTEQERNHPDNPCFEVLFDIIEGTQDLTFDFPHMRLSKDIVLAAILLAKWKNKKVVLCEPTSYYSMQAVRFARACKVNEPGEPGTLTICVPGMLDASVFGEADVIVHHGCDFKQFLPTSAMRQRHVIQIFAGEDVPCDSRSLSSIMCSYASDE